MPMTARGCLFHPEVVVARSTPAGMENCWGPRRPSGARSTGSLVMARKSMIVKGQVGHHCIAR